MRLFHDFSLVSYAAHISSFNFASAASKYRSRFWRNNNASQVVISRTCFTLKGPIYRYVCDLNHDAGAIILADSHKVSLI